ncbi:MAG TPA: LysR family transcriptional regulator [Eggerthellaceae bacterium]|nr:LysR family transcriptional regulator [Eggerthellaceae bacterium]
MLFKQIELFCEVAKTGSFTRTAELFNISQSAVSQQIKSLETYLDVKLLTRSGRHFALTPEGYLFAKRGEIIVAEVDKAIFDVRCMSKGEPTSLRVGYLNHYDGWEVQGAVAAFARRHPNVDVTAIPDSHDGLYQGMLNGSVDVVFNDRRRQLSADFENVHLMTCLAYVEVSEASEFAYQESVTPQELSKISCIIIADEEQKAIEEAHYRNVLGFSGPIMFAKTLEQARMMVASNKGYLPLESRERSGRTGTVIRRIPLSDGTDQIAHEYYAFWLKSRSNALIREFAEILKELFKSNKTN